MTVPNSLVVIVPSPSLSKSENASLNSAICSSVSWSAYETKKGNMNSDLYIIVIAYNVLFFCVGPRKMYRKNIHTQVYEN